MHALALSVTVLTLVTTNTPIYAVAQDGPRLAWIAPIGVELPDQNGTRAGVYTRLLPGGRPYRVTTTMAFPFGQQQLVVAGDRLAWDQFEGGITNTSWVAFAPARRGVLVPSASRQFHMDHDPSEGESVDTLVGRGSVLGFTVGSLDAVPAGCGTEDLPCTGSAPGPQTAYAVRGRKIVQLRDADLMSHLPAPPVPPPGLPASAHVYPTSRGAVVVEGRLLYVVTPSRPRLALVTKTRGRATDFSVAGPRVVWAETLDDHQGRIRAIVFGR